MIKTEAISPSALKIIPSEKLTEADFHGLAPQVDAIISKFGQARLLIDVSTFTDGKAMRLFKRTRVSSRTISGKSSGSP